MKDRARHGVSLDAQAEACIAYCNMRHLPVAAVLRDEGVSSRIPLTERPVGRELCRMIDTGEVQHIVAYSISRLFRDSVEAITHSRRWDRAGISLHLLDVGGQVVDTGSAIGRFFFSSPSCQTGTCRWQSGNMRGHYAGAAVLSRCAPASPRSTTPWRPMYAP